MELFVSANEPRTYVAIKIGDAHEDSMFLIGTSSHMTQLKVVELIRFKEGAIHLRMEQGYRFTRAVPSSANLNTLSDNNGSDTTMQRASKDNPVWKLVEASDIKPNWTEIEDSILRGWRKESVLLCEAFPKRTFQEIRDRMVFLKQ